MPFGEDGDLPLAFYQFREAALFRDGRHRDGDLLQAFPAEGAVAAGAGGADILNNTDGEEVEAEELRRAIPA